MNHNSKRTIRKAREGYDVDSDGGKRVAGWCVLIVLSLFMGYFFGTIDRDPEPLDLTDKTLMIGVNVYGENDVQCGIVTERHEADPVKP